MLNISRQDVSSTEIQQLDSHLPFDIEKFLHSILIKNEKNEQVILDPIGPQIAMINGFLNSKYRFLVGCLSRRTGKTLISNALGLITILQPDTDVLIISPNYNLSLISYELQRKFIKSFGLEIIRDNIKDRVLTLANGSSIRLGSINQVDSTVGRSYQLIIFDEAALSSKGEDAFTVSLRPTLDRANSKAIFISTPRGQNWFYHFFQRGYSDDFPEWISIHSDYRENPRIIENDIIEARNSMSKATFSQEYEAEFNQLQGAIYALDSDCIIYNLAGSLQSKDYDVIIGADFGWRDPTAYVVIFIDINEHKAFIVEEWEDNGKTTKEYAEALKKLDSKYDADYIFADSANAQIRWDLAQDYDISTRSAKKAKLEGIGYVGSFIDNNRLMIDASCVKTIKSINNYQWRESINSKDEFTKEEPLHNEYSHLNDAIRYALYSYSQNIG